MSRVDFDSERCCQGVWDGQGDFESGQFCQEKGMGWLSCRPWSFCPWGLCPEDYVTI